MKLKNISKIVLKVLKEDIESRKNDLRLFLKVQENYIPNIGQANLRDVYGLVERGMLPSFEGMRRARQKIQEKNPELKDTETEYYRAKEEEKYLEFARS